MLPRAMLPVPPPTWYGLISPRGPRRSPGALGSSWALLRSWALLGAPWRCLAFLGAPGCALGVSWAFPGSFLGAYRLCCVLHCFYYVFLWFLNDFQVACTVFFLRFDAESALMQVRVQSERR